MLSSDHQKRAGWGRARQWAEWRKANPSPLEKQTQEFLTSLGIPFLVEYEIHHADGMPQWFDVYIPGHNVAIEVDGSHGWHSYNGSSSKMASYDELKTRYCEEHGIHLYWVRDGRAALDLEQIRKILLPGETEKSEGRGPSIDCNPIPF